MLFKNDVTLGPEAWATFHIMVRDVAHDTGSAFIACPDGLWRYYPGARLKGPPSFVVARRWPCGSSSMYIVVCGKPAPDGGIVMSLEDLS